MKEAGNIRTGRVTNALEKCAASVSHLGGRRWEFELVNGKSIPATARLLDEWLILDAAVSDRAERPDLWRLLELNAGLEGLSKFVLMPDARSVHLRADVPLMDEQDSESDAGSSGETATRILGACAGLKAAFRQFAGEPAGDRRPVAPLPDSGLASLCADAGWPFVERSIGKVMVDLDVPVGFYQATVEQHESGAYASVEIARLESLAEINRQAMGALLLRTGAIVRLARPAAQADETAVAIRFEVSFGVMPTAGELQHAFSALSLACALSGREARAFSDEFIAREYLAIGGVAADDSEKRPEVMLAAGD